VSEPRTTLRGKILTPPNVAGGSVMAVVLLATPMVASWEGLRQDPYKDIAGVWTVCYGETANVQQRRYSVGECQTMLNASLLKHATPILGCLPPATPLEVKAAFVSFGYNVGVNAACGSKAAQKARAADFRGACNSLMNWVYVGKRRVQGLVNRRAAERDLCLKGVA
jgi:lysozyme